MISASKGECSTLILEELYQTNEVYGRFRRTKYTNEFLKTCKTVCNMSRNVA